MLLKVAHRIEIQLTSKRPDGFWTWRAAGAREPRGDLHAELLAPDVKVGDILRVEVEMDVDGMKIREVLSEKAARKRKSPQLIEHIGSGDFKEGTVIPEGVDVSGADDPRRKRSKGGGAGKAGRDGRGRRGEGGRGGESGHGSSHGNRDFERREGGRGRHQPQRLRPGKKHVSAWLGALPEEHRELGGLLVEKGVRAMREELLAEKESKESEEVAAAGGVAVSEGAAEAGGDGGDRQGGKSGKSDKTGKTGKTDKTDKTEERKAQARKAWAEQAATFDELSDAYLSARWRDRAEAAGSLGSKLELRDLRSVVAEDHRAAPDEESQKIATDLRKRLTERVEKGHASWLAELGSAITSGRVVPALRLSSRSPKVGVPLPELLSEKLCELASSALDADESEDSWSAVLEAASTSPVRLVLRPASLPEAPSEKLIDSVRKLGDRLPLVAAEFAEFLAEQEAADQVQRPVVQKADGERVQEQEGQAEQEAEQAQRPVDQVEEGKQAEDEGQAEQAAER